MNSNLKVAVLMDVPSLTQQEVFEWIASEAEQRRYTSSHSEVKKELELREKEGITGMMDGFAIPHAKSSSIRIPAIIVLKLKNKVEWYSMDGKPIDFVIALLIPENAKGTIHLKILSEVAKMLMKDEAKEALKGSKTESEVRHVLENYIVE